MKWRLAAVWAGTACTALFPTRALEARLPPVVGDAMPQALTARPGDPIAGRAVFIDRDRGHCLLCHTVRSIDAPFQGDVGPDLSAGTKLDDAQVRLRLVDASQVNPRTVMPSYHRVDGLNQVGAAYRGRPALSAQQVEDLIAFLRTLSAHGTASHPEPKAVQ